MRELILPIIIGIISIFCLQLFLIAAVMKRRGKLNQVILSVNSVVVLILTAVFISSSGINIINGLTLITGIWGIIITFKPKKVTIIEYIVTIKDQ